MGKDIALLIMSCDKYQDLWGPFIQLYDKYWPNPQIPAYFCSDTISLNHNHIKSIVVGVELEWSARLRHALNNVAEDYVLLVLDDYFLIDSVDEDRLVEYVFLMKEFDICYLRVFPCPGPDFPSKISEGLGEIKIDAQYRTSTQASIWNKADLLDFIIDTESIWDFELKGSGRSSNIKKPFLSVYPDLSREYAYNYLCTAVYKGRWMREVLPLMKKEGLSIDFGLRKLETRFECFYRKWYHRSPYFFQYLMDVIKYKF